MPSNYVAVTNYSSLVFYNNQLSGCDIALCGRAFFRTGKFLQITEHSMLSMSRSMFYKTSDISPGYVLTGVKNNKFFLLGLYDYFIQPINYSLVPYQSKTSMWIPYPKLARSTSMCELSYSLGVEIRGWRYGQLVLDINHCLYQNVYTQP